MKVKEIEEFYNSAPMNRLAVKEINYLFFRIYNLENGIRNHKKQIQEYVEGQGFSLKEWDDFDNELWKLLDEDSV